MQIRNTLTLLVAAAGLTVTLLTGGWMPQRQTPNPRLALTVPFTRGLQAPCPGCKGGKAITD
jgi:hypothetical protein